MKKVKQPQGLISVLLDTSIEFGERDDAAMDLGGFDEPEAEEALLQVACNPKEDDDILDTCGQSLAEIWCRKDNLDIEKLSKLAKISQDVAIATVKALRKDWSSILPPEYY